MKKYSPIIAAAIVLSISTANLTTAFAGLVPKNTTGLGVVTSIASSKDVAEKADGVAQVDSLIAVISTDKDGKITKCSIDAAQTKVNFNAKGVVTSDKKAEITTKVEKGEAYGMKKGSKISKEWNEQADAFAKWTIGKTVAEVKALKVKKVDDSHTAVPDVPELTSSVTVSVGDFIEAIEKAAKNVAVGSAADAKKTGVGVATSISSSKDATDKADGVGQVDSLIAAVTLDANNKIIASTFDAAQTKVSFSAAGKITADKTKPIMTKLELGDAYGMKKSSKISKEWNQQAEAFSKWTLNKTLDQVKALKVKKVDDSHPAVPDVPDLTTSVTISVGDFMTALEKAVKNAK